MSSKRRLQRLFIANRGEIARRIGLTTKRLGIETATIVGPGAPPAYLAGVIDYFHPVEEDSTAIYLSGERMVAAAKATGCDSLHPGFGFLSENAAFARLVEASGLVWVGPPPKAIDAMASKARAREVAAAAGVPVLEGLENFALPADETGDFSKLEAFCERVGYPVLLKAALGGGGKGMRPVIAASELKAAALRAGSEALNAFGDQALICEKFLTDPRHVEVQILADGHGTVLALGDRDCSIQRRHQKIVEEAPAPGLGPKTRQAMHEAARRLAEKVGYVSAGTVEFLVDWSKGARSEKEQKFYFLEMNTRLQVEHPVTEEVFGVDLVEWQLRVAMGERLPEELATRTPRGHSIEVRLYAEDPEKNFLPSPGPVAAFVPADGPGVRWEVGLTSLETITGSFDPMVAKLVVTAESRTAALDRLAQALERTFFAGPQANRELLAAIARHSIFREGPVSTHYLEEHGDELLKTLAERRERVRATAEEILEDLVAGRLGNDAAPMGHDVRALTAFAFTGENGAKSQGDLTVDLSGVTFRGQGAQKLSARGGIGWLGGARDRRKPFWYAALASAEGRRFWVHVDGETFFRADAGRRRGGADAEQRQGEIVAPVPGRVVALKVGAGEMVEQDQPVAVLESMKMEFEVRAPRAGKIGVLEVEVGQQVTAGKRLATWDDSQ